MPYSAFTKANEQSQLVDWLPFITFLLHHSGATCSLGSAQYPNRLEREAMILSSFAGIIMVRIFTCKCNF